MGRREVVEFIVPFLIDANKAVNRSKIVDFLKVHKISTPKEFRKKFDHPDGLMNNFIRIYGGQTHDR